MGAIMDKGMKKMIGYAVGATGLAIVDLTGIAVIEGYKDVQLSPAIVNESNTSQILVPANYAIDNATADLFIAGLVVFGTFLAIIVLALVGKIIMGLFTGGDTY